MKLYRNIMEDLVEEFYEDIMDKHPCCTCDQCRSDVVAFALNQLEPHYAVTSAGASISKASNLRRQHRTDIQAALTRAMQVVTEFPRHEQIR